MAWINEANWPGAWAAILFSPIVVSDSEYIVYVGAYGVQRFYKYNISTDAWTELAVPPAAITGAISMSPDGTKLAAHAINGNILFIYNIAGNSWSSSSAAPSLAIDGGATAQIHSTVWAVDNNTIWCQVRGYITSWRVKCFRYVVSTDTWTQYTNYISPSQHAGVCMSINSAGTALFVGNIGDNSYAGTKYVIATDTYSTFSIGSGYKFYRTIDRTAKLWHWDRLTSYLGVKYYDCDTETASAIIFPDDSERNITGVLAGGIYKVASIIAWHKTAEPKNRSYSSPPTVTIQTCQDVVGTTATGRGNITDLGGASVTAHGHCWNTTANPTISGGGNYLGAVDNGAASATGAFTSAITGLTPGTGYYTRAFATNAGGTSYSDNVYFVASKARAGYVWKEGSNEHIFDENAIEQILINQSDVDDSPVDGATTDPISSNWAYDMAALVAGKDYGLSFEGIVTTAVSATHFKVTTLAGKGAGFFIPNAGDPYEIYVVQADGAAPEGLHTPVLAYDTSDGDFQNADFVTGDIEVGDIVLIMHPWLAFIKDIITDIASAVPEPPTAKSLQDILHKDTNYTFDNTRHGLEAIADEIHEMHAHSHILFITPEAVASITADNIVIKAELVKLGEVDHITQSDALDFPNFTIYDLCVMGSNNGNAWTTSNLADIKVVPKLPLLCFDKVAAAYLEMGTDGLDATTKTTIDASAKIEGSELGMGASYFSIIGLVVGVQTISTSATYHTLNMENVNLSEIVYATADVDVDAGNGGTPQSDVVLGWLPAILENGTIGLDEAGEELPATIAFFGAGFEAAKLTTLGKAVIYLCAHILVQAQKKPVEIVGTIQNLRRLIFGNMGGSFSNTAPLVEWIAGQDGTGAKLPVDTSLVDLLNTIDGIVDTLLTRITAAVATASGLSTHDTDIKALLSTVQTDLDNPSQYMANLSTLETRLSAARAGYLDQLDFALQEAIAAIPTTAMRGTDNAALAVDLEDAMQKATGPAYNQDTDSLEAIREKIDTLGTGGDATEAKQDTIIAMIAAFS